MKSERMPVTYTNRKSIIYDSVEKRSPVGVVPYLCRIPTLLVENQAKNPTQIGA